MKTDREGIAKRYLKKGYDHLTDRERKVVDRVMERGTISRNTYKQLEDERTFGERVADRIAEFGGSWTFIGLFLATLLAWVVLNSYVLARRDAAFDPYPYILLNLFLSMIASLQAPVIMMSQNRQTEGDRIDAAHDYEVNLKAEIEIMALHEKLDEMRHSEFIGMRDDIVRLAEQVKRIDEKLSERQASR
jgi:uncharacterized membrane protein